MNKSSRFWSRLCETRLIALLSPKNADECRIACEALNPLGVTLEIALRSPTALAGFEATLKAYPDALLLAGTVMTVAQAEAVIDAGAAGVVSADYIPDVVEVCARRDVLCVPGGLTDAGKQLVQKARIYGCTLDELRFRYPYQWVYKLFPALTVDGSNMGVAAALKGPYPDLRFIYTGGITLDNLAEVVRRDAGGIFCGSALTKHIDQPDKMAAEARKWLDIIHFPARSPAASAATKAAASGEPPRVVTFGELMLRLSPPAEQRLVQTASMDVNFGGAEANAAVAFAHYGLRSRFVTALPEHEIGQAAVNSLRKFGVDTSMIQRTPGRLGIYYLEYGASQRPSKVIYDRAGTTIANITIGDIDWGDVFKDADWFHWSGITPALSESCAAVTLEALRAARRSGLTVSVDLNYRSKLWSPAQAREVMEPLMQYVDICIGSEEDADKMFGMEAGASDVEKGKLDIASYEAVARKLVEQFGLKKAALTLRESISASDNDWSACLWNGDEFLLSRKYSIHIVDRMGSGDSFSSGLIYGLISGMSDCEALEFGAAASCLKQTIRGDYNLVSIDEVKKLAGGSASGRVQR